MIGVRRAASWCPTAAALRALSNVPVPRGGGGGEGGGGSSPPLSVLPGVATAATAAGVSFLLAEELGQAILSLQGLGGGDASSPISGIPVAILLGLGVNNAVNLSASVRPGLKFSTTTLLRAGIVCVGAKLSAFDVVQLGAAGIPVVAASITAGLFFIPRIAARAGLSRKMGALIACGTSICGVTAITALAPAIKADPKDTAVAVANVVAFGTLGMLTYPYLAHAAFNGASEPIGLFLGVGVHDTSQVLGAAMTFREVYGDEVALKVAAVTKLTRNLFLAGVIPAMTWQNAQHEEREDAAAAKLSSAAGEGEKKKTEEMSGLATFQKYVPMFVVGFVGMSAARSLGDATLLNSGAAFGVLDAASYKAGINAIGSTGSKYLLGTAMAAVGLSTSISTLRGVGVAPFAVGLSGALVVSGTGFCTIQALHHAGFL